MRVLVAALLVLVAGALPGSSSAAAAPTASDLVAAELVTEPRAVEPGKPFTVGIRLSMKDGWHTYWRNPGDSGLATEIAWTLPDGFSAGPIQWPVPERIPVSHLVNYGYERETTLLVEVTPPAGLATGRNVNLTATVSYLVCERECIPGEAKLAASLPSAASGAGGGPDPATAYIFAAARDRLPKPAPWPARIESAGGVLRLRVDAKGIGPDTVASAYVFPMGETVIEHAAPQALAFDADGFVLTLKASAFASAPPPPDMPGLLVITGPDGPDAAKAYRIGTEPAAKPAAPREAAVSPVAAAVAADLSVPAVLGAALFAFLGGLVLNLMPCVFPVLSIKVLSLVTYSGRDRRAVRLSGLAYTAGVVASFLVLAGMLLAIRAGGAGIGWGFQLQSPLTVAALAFLLFGVGLSLSGVVDLGSGIAARAGGVSERAGPLGSFGTGVLAALVATPCTAPFMGAAVGYALTAPAAVALAIFAALGLGLALPFLILTFQPSLLARLPRPGAWMDTLKQVLAFPIYATVAWLIFVLSQQVGPGGLFAALIGLVLIGFAAWTWRWAVMGEGWPRRLGQGLAAAALSCLAALSWSITSDPGPGERATASSSGGAERYSQARLDQLRSEDRPVFVNMTAAWCITCIVNERVVLSRPAIQAAFEGKRIVYLKGDWTNQNPEITRLLEQHGRSGVPLYVVYSGRGEPKVLPQILTESIVLEGLSGIATPSRRADAGADRVTQAGDLR